MLTLLTSMACSAPLNDAFAMSYYYTSDVEHLFFHCLIAHPEIAFKKNNPMRESLKTDCITPLEFKRVLNSLYENNYILVSLFDCFKNENGIGIKQKVKVPVGKKPIILSFDDVNYDNKKAGLGMVDKLIVDDSGKIASLTNIDGKQVISYDNEFLPIMENFISEHPSFSPFGAKGTLNLTGYDGILGYRISHTNTSKDKTLEVCDASLVVETLKSLGWTFACHSYGHYHMKKLSLDGFKNEMKKWKDEIEPIIGKTNAYVYPYGEWEVFSENEISEKHKVLTDNGFCIFLGVGIKQFYSYLPNSHGHKVLFMDRCVIDGTTLLRYGDYLSRFFNASEIIDDVRFKTF